LSILVPINLDGESGRRIRNNEPENVGPSYNPNLLGSDFLDQLVSTASENIGTRYRTGGTTKEGFDCLMCTTLGL
jgi:cell wall-associated NlpC family hydrolase